MSATSDSSQAVEPLPRKGAAPEAHWNFLEKGFDEIMDVKESKLSNKRFMELYTAVTNLLSALKSLRLISNGGPSPKSFEVAFTFFAYSELAERRSLL